jgi:hypothetical protein
MANSPMPPRVAAIKAAIESKQDFTGLAHGGEAEVFRWARAHGMRGGALVLQWHEAYRQRQAQARQVMSEVDKTPRPARIETEFRDLDHWASDDDQDDGGDDDPDDDLIPCAACAGRGKDSAGNRCAVCGGSGKVTPSDGDENEDETDDDEDQDE